MKDQLADWKTRVSEFVSDALSTLFCIGRAIYLIVPRRRDASASPTSNPQEGMMKVKLGSAMGIALIAILLLAASAGAEQGGGTGALTAQGNGFAGMKGAGEITLTGNGILRIRDHAGDAHVEIEGKGKHREAGGWIIYAGFDGTARITGSQVSVTLTGKNIRLHAEGTGKFVLRGHGTYHTEHEDGEWTREGKVITLP